MISLIKSLKLIRGTKTLARFYFSDKSDKQKGKLQVSNQKMKGKKEEVKKNIEVGDQKRKQWQNWKQQKSQKQGKQIRKFNMIKQRKEEPNRENQFKKNIQKKNLIQQERIQIKKIHSQNKKYNQTNKNQNSKSFHKKKSKNYPKKKEFIQSPNIQQIVQSPISKKSTLKNIQKNTQKKITDQSKPIGHNQPVFYRQLLNAYSKGYQLKYEKYNHNVHAPLFINYLNKILEQYKNQSDPDSKYIKKIQILQYYNDIPYFVTDKNSLNKYQSQISQLIPQFQITKQYPSPSFIEKSKKKYSLVCILPNSRPFVVQQFRKQANSQKQQKKYQQKSQEKDKKKFKWEAELQLTKEINQLQQNQKIKRINSLYIQNLIKDTQNNLIAQKLPQTQYQSEDNEDIKKRNEQIRNKRMQIGKIKKKPKSYSQIRRKSNQMKPELQKQLNSLIMKNARFTIQQQLRKTNYKINTQDLALIKSLSLKQISKFVSTYVDPFLTKVQIQNIHKNLRQQIQTNFPQLITQFGLQNYQNLMKNMYQDSLKKYNVFNSILQTQFSKQNSDLKNLQKSIKNQKQSDIIRLMQNRLAFQLVSKSLKEKIKKQKQQQQQEQKQKGKSFGRNNQMKQSGILKKKKIINKPDKQDKSDSSNNLLAQKFHLQKMIQDFDKIIQQNWNTFSEKSDQQITKLILDNIFNNIEPQLFKKSGQKQKIQYTKVSKKYIQSFSQQNIRIKLKQLRYKKNLFNMFSVWQIIKLKQEANVKQRKKQYEARIFLTQFQQTFQKYKQLINLQIQQKQKIFSIDDYRKKYEEQLIKQNDQIIKRRQIVLKEFKDHQINFLKMSYIPKNIQQFKAIFFPEKKIKNHLTQYQSMLLKQLSKQQLSKKISSIQQQIQIKAQAMKKNYRYAKARGILPQKMKPHPITEFQLHLRQIFEKEDKIRKALKSAQSIQRWTRRHQPKNKLYQQSQIQLKQDSTKKNIESQIIQNKKKKKKNNNVLIKQLNSGSQMQQQSTHDQDLQTQPTQNSILPKKSINQIINPLIKDKRTLFFDGVVQKKRKNYIQQQKYEYPQQYKLNELKKQLNQQKDLVKKQVLYGKIYLLNGELEKLQQLYVKSSNKHILKLNLIANSIQSNYKSSFQFFIQVLKLGNQSVLQIDTINKVLQMIILEKNQQDLDIFVKNSAKSNINLSLLNLTPFNIYFQQQFSRNQLFVESYPKISTFLKLFEISIKNNSRYYNSQFDFYSLLALLYKKKQLSLANTLIDLLAQAKLINNKQLPFNILLRIVLDSQNTSIQRFIKILQGITLHDDFDYQNFQEQPLQLVNNKYGVRTQKPYQQIAKTRNFRDRLMKHYQEEKKLKETGILQRDDFLITPNIPLNKYQSQLLQLQRFLKIKNNQLINDQLTELVNILKKELLYYKSKNGKAAFCDSNLIKCYEIERKRKNKLVLLAINEIAFTNNQISIVYDIYHKSYKLLKCAPIKPMIQNYFTSVINMPVTNSKQLYEKIQTVYNNIIFNLKAIIKCKKDPFLAYSIFYNQLIQPLIVKFQQKKLRLFLSIYSTRKSNKRILVKRAQIYAFVKTLAPEGLIAQYTNDQKILDFNLRKKLAPSNLWQQMFKQKRINQLIQLNRLDKLDQRWRFSQQYKHQHMNHKQFLQKQFEAAKQKQINDFEFKKKFQATLLDMQALLHINKFLASGSLQQQVSRIQQNLIQQQKSVLQAVGLYPLNLKIKSKYLIQRIHRIRINDYKYAQNDLIKLKKIPYIRKKKLLFNRMRPIDLAQVIQNNQRLWKTLNLQISLKRQDIVQDLMIWGIQNNEPMAVYMGEKMAQVTRQMIPHGLAIKVSQFLSLRRQIPVQIKEKANQALKIVGPIKRNLIYNFDSEYEHIFRDNEFEKYLSLMELRSGNSLNNNILKQKLKNPIRWMNWDVDNKMAEYSIRQRAKQMLKNI